MTEKDPTQAAASVMQGYADLTTFSKRDVMGIVARAVDADRMAREPKLAPVVANMGKGYWINQSVTTSLWKASSVRSLDRVARLLASIASDDPGMKDADVVSIFIDEMMLDS